jgi:hypothetical protein
MSSRLALIVLPLAFASCRKTESVTVPPPVDTVQAALPDTSAPAPDSGLVETSAPTTEPRFDSVVDALPPEVRDSVRLWQKRVDSLRAAWERDMAEAAPLKGFAKRPWDHPPPQSARESPERARLFRGIEECGGDSTFDVYLAGGDVHTGGLESHSFYVAPGFTLSGGIHQGMSTLEATRAMGKPYRNGDGYLSWVVQDWGEKEYSNRVAWKETVRFFFLEDRLVAVWVVHPFYDC